MPPPPPPMDACIRAFELRAQGYPLRHIAELLTAEGWKCSHTTADKWAELGASVLSAKERLNRQRAREELADGLEQDMARIRVAFDKGEITLLDALPQLKWLYQERAKLIGAYDQTIKHRWDDKEPPLDAKAQAVVDAAMARNGAVRAELEEQA